MLAAFAAGYLTSAALASSASEGPKVRHLQIENPRSAIFVGNSFFYYNNGINEHLLKLIRAADADAKFRITMITISGAGLDWHDVASYFRPDAVARYGFDANNNIVFNDVSKHLFDITVMMDCSQCPLYPKLQDAFYSSVKKDSVIVRRHGSTPVLFMSWAYQDKPEMTQQLADAYTRAGNQNDALVVPAGLAFSNATKQFSDINLYSSDKRHPSLAGTYLAACTTYAALFGKSPVGSKYEAGLSHEMAGALQSVAWATVQDYLGTP
jgi:hypothetical protein